MTWLDALGYLAATLTTSAFVPQAWLIFRTRDASGVSLTMYSVFTLGVALWLVYGVSLEAWPIVVANVITMVLAGSILTMKLVLDHESKQIRRSLGGQVALPFNQTTSSAEGDHLH